MVLGATGAGSVVLGANGVGTGEAVTAVIGLAPNAGLGAVVNIFL